MNSLVFLITAYTALLLEVALRPWLEVGTVAPSFLLVVMVFVALSASSTAALGAALFLGVVADVLVRPYPDATILGPMAAGYFVGAYVVLQLRGMLFRNSVWTVVAMTLAAGVFVELVAVSLVSLRGVGFLAGDPAPGWRALRELRGRFEALGYSLLLAAPVGLALLRTRKWWSFGAGGRYE